MKNLAILICLLISVSVSAQREPLDVTIDFESYDPPSTLVVPENPITHAKFPFVDIHSHHWRMGEMDLDELIGKMDSMNMRVVVNLSGRGGERLLGMKNNIEKYGYQDRIINFTNIELRSITESDWAQETVKQLEFDVKEGNARGLKIYKSQGMHHTDSLGNRIKIDDPRIGPVWDKCGELGIPVLIHSADPKPFWAPHDSLNERWLELKLRPNRKREADNPASWETIIAEQHRMFKNHPNTTFINAHMGWYANDLNKLSEILEEIPNMYIEIGAVIAELGRQPRQAKKFLTKYQDRVLFGKDSFKPEEFPTYFRVLETEDEYFPYYKRYHAFWRMYGLGLPDEVLKKLYYKNAAKIVPGLEVSMFEEGL